MYSISIWINSTAIINMKIKDVVFIVNETTFKQRPIDVDFRIKPF